VDERRRADVQAAGGLVGDDHARAAAQLAGQDQLLLVAAGELPRRQGRAGRAHVETADELAREAHDRAEIEHARPRKRRLVEDLERGIAPQVEVQDQPVAVPVIADVRRVVLDEVPRAPARRVQPGDGDLARFQGTHARDGLHQLALPVAIDPGDAQNFPGVHLQAQTAHGGQPAVVDHAQIARVDQAFVPAGSRAGLARVRRVLVARQGQHARLLIGPQVRQVVPDHFARQGVLVGVAGQRAVDHPPGAQHRDEVGHLQHFFQLVADEDDGLTLFRHPAQDAGQRFGFLRREDGGRLVEDQHVGAAIQAAEDLDALLRPDRQLLHAHARIDVQAVLRRDFAHLPLGLGHVEEAPAVQPQDDVFGDGEGLHQLEMLVNHADPQANRVGGGMDGDRLTFDQDLSFVGLVQAE